MERPEKRQRREKVDDMTQPKRRRRDRVDDMDEQPIAGTLADAKMSTDDWKR